MAWTGKGCVPFSMGPIIVLLCRSHYIVREVLQMQSAEEHACEMCSNGRCSHVFGPPRPTSELHAHRCERCPCCGEPRYVVRGTQITPARRCVLLIAGYMMLVLASQVAESQLTDSIIFLRFSAHLLGHAWILSILYLWPCKRRPHVSNLCMWPSLGVVHVLSPGDLIGYTQCHLHSRRHAMQISSV